MFHEIAIVPSFLERRKSVYTQPVSFMNEEAFCTFYYATAPSLQGYIRRICGNATLAEDILQEAFYHFLRADLPKMDAPQMKAYLFKIATSLVVDHWRHAKRERFWKSLWFSPAIEPRDQREDVSQAFSQLNPAERALLWLAYVEGFDHSEIASALGLKEKSIRVLLFRARKKLARVLARHTADLKVTS